jgi:hypothetical protein
MTQRERKFVWALIAAGLAALVWKFAPPRTPSPPQGVTACDDSLWSYVYHRQRLEIIEPCKTVEGVVEKVLHEADGDLHIRLDVEDKSLLNDRNYSSQHGMLVVEPICQKAPTQADAIGPCRNFAGTVFDVRVGMRVRITGPLSSTTNMDGKRFTRSLRSCRCREILSRPKERSFLSSRVRP